jgi:hypothetical protein
MSFELLVTIIGLFVLFREGSASASGGGVPAPSDPNQPLLEPTRAQCQTWNGQYNYPDPTPGQLYCAGHYPELYPSGTGTPIYTPSNPNPDPYHSQPPGAFSENQDPEAPPWYQPPGTIVKPPRIV